MKTLTDKDLFLLGSIDAKKIKNKNDYFLVRFIIYYDKDILKMSGANFRIKKINKKEISLLNLSNGNIYDLN